MNNLSVLLIASEVVPFAKTGGLADVLGALPKALCEKGVDARVVMPKYKTIPLEYVSQMTYLGNTQVPVAWRTQYCGVFSLVHEGVTFYFIDNEYYFGRDYLYGHFDQAEQFAFFSRAVFEAMPIMDFYPNVLHANDWQTGLVPLYYDAFYRHDPRFSGMKTVYTIHNLRYQGRFDRDLLEEIVGVGPEYFTPDRIEYYDDINYMKAGIAFANKITTVSPTYAEEIKNPYFGEGLDATIRSRAYDLIGIVNGIDTKRYDPHTDSKISVQYTWRSMARKKENKMKLQEELGLPVSPDVPMIGLVTRLVPQKGLDLIDRVMDEICSLDMQLVVLGTGDAQYENMFKHFAWKYSDKVSANIRYDDGLAQRIYASSDLFLMPSQFEPCGLGQLIAMRYGCLPLVRETGGLKDTVAPYNQYTGEGNGFSFTNYNAHDMLAVLQYALSVYYEQGDAWKTMMKRNMLQKLDWGNSAEKYIDVYRYTMM